MPRIAQQLRRLAGVLVQRLTAIVVFLLIWEIAVRGGFLYPTPVPPASSAILALRKLLSSGEYVENTLASLQRMFLGYALATVIAIPLGFVVGWSKTAEVYLIPLLRVFRQVPLVALFPVFVLFFGLGEVPCVLILLLAAMWSIMLNTKSGVQNVDPALVKAARAVGASQWDLLTKVVLPSTVPSIFTGIRCAYTEILLVLIPVEMLGVDSGWGVGVGSHEHHGQNHILMYAIIISMALTGVGIDYLVVTLERELCRWRQSVDSVPRPVLI